MKEILSAPFHVKKSTYFLVSLWIMLKKRMYFYLPLLCYSFFSLLIRPIFPNIDWYVNVFVFFFFAYIVMRLYVILNTKAFAYLFQAQRWQIDSARIHIELDGKFSKMMQLDRILQVERFFGHQVLFLSQTGVVLIPVSAWHSADLNQVEAWLNGLGKG